MLSKSCRPQWRLEITIHEAVIVARRPQAGPYRVYLKEGEERAIVRGGQNIFEVKHDKAIVPNPKIVSY